MASLLITYSQAYHAYYFSKLQIRPHLDFLYEESPEEFGLLIENDGLGPAFVKRLNVYFDLDHVTDWKEFEKRCGLKNNILTFSDPKGGFSIKENNKMELYKHIGTNKTSESIALLKCIHEHFTLLIQYCSLDYEDCVTVCSPHSQCRNDLRN